MQISNKLVVLCYRIPPPGTHLNIPSTSSPQFPAYPTQPPSEWMNANINDTAQNSDASTTVGTIYASGKHTQPDDQIVHFDSTGARERHPFCPFNSTTCLFIYGVQSHVIQGLLNFNYSCRRENCSVADMIYPFGGHYIQKFYWGTKEMLLPVYTSIEEVVKKHTYVDVVVNLVCTH
jgi:hypothetical protein